MLLESDVMLILYESTFFIQQSVIVSFFAMSVLPRTTPVDVKYPCENVREYGSLPNSVQQLTESTATPRIDPER